MHKTERAWQALDEVSYGPTPAEEKSLVFSRSIYAAADIAAGELFTAANIRIMRPGHGTPPYLYDLLLGRTARDSYSRSNPISLDKLL